MFTRLCNCDARSLIHKLWLFPILGSRRLSGWTGNGMSLLVQIWANHVMCVCTCAHAFVHMASLEFRLLMNLLCVFCVTGGSMPLTLVLPMLSVPCIVCQPAVKDWEVGAIVWNTNPAWAVLERLRFKGRHIQAFMALVQPSKLFWN